MGFGNINTRKSRFCSIFYVRCYEMASRGLLDEEIAGELKVLPATLKGWIKNIPFLADLMEAAREQKDEISSNRYLLARFPGLTVDQLRFLGVYSVCGSITRAAEVSGVPTHYNWLKRDNGYREAFEEADFQARDRLLIEARRRAVEGVERLKFYNGQPIMIPCRGGDRNAIKSGEDDDGNPIYMKQYTEHFYSDTLLCKLLDNLHPEFIKRRAVFDAETGGIVAQIINASVMHLDYTKSTIVDDKYIESAAKALEEQKDDVVEGEKINGEEVIMEEIGIGREVEEEE